jgi:PHD/YefM family antitoxin component YafN of YafNO toxin-antitoxin module
MAETPSTRNFRENLKHFFDLARKNPIAVNRGTERYVLMSENEFMKMKEEVMNLQKSLISTLQHLNGETAPEIDLDADEENDQLLQEYVAKYEHLKGKKGKKAKVG